MRKVLLILLILVLAGGAGAYFFWKHREETKVVIANNDYAQAKEYLAQGETGLAIPIIMRNSGLFTVNPPATGDDWLQLAIDAFTKVKDPIRLSVLYESFPRIAEASQETALLVAAGLLAQNKLDNYEQVKTIWANKNPKVGEWFALDADALTIQGKSEDALKLLQSHTFEGAEDTPRLLRLAMLSIKSDLKKTWDYLGEAEGKDPTNSSITSYRGQILEIVNQPKLARLEYIVAIQKERKNPYLINQLAEFFRRQSEYGNAIKALEFGLNLPNADFLWVKELFWTKVVVPPSVDLSKLTPSKGDLSPLIDYLLALPKNKLWDEAAFDKIPNAQNYLKISQETFWLRLAQALIDKNEPRAAQLLESNLFSVDSYSPDLENALKQIIAYRHNGVVKVDRPTARIITSGLVAELKESPKHVRHELFDQLDAIANKADVNDATQNDDAELDTLLHSDLAYSAAFLAAGWLEAGIDFPIPSVLPDNLPPWYGFAVTQAIRYTKSPQEALEFATKQKPTEALQALIGELMIQTGSLDAGLEQLKPLLDKKDQIGSRAAWLISLIQLQRKEYDAARNTVTSNEGLSKALAGKELMARIALAQGDNHTADQLYGALEGESAEAQFYLAQRAFQDKNWKRARELVIKLLRQYPDNINIQQAFKKINEEEKKAETAPANASPETK